MVQASDSIKGFAVEVRKFLDVSNWSINAMSKAAGVSSSALSQVLSNKYPGDIASIRAKVESVMSRERDKAATSRVAKSFVETSVSRSVFEVAHSCRVIGDIGVCYSAAGLGKTEAVREYARQNPDVILIEADPGYTAMVLFLELRDVVGGSARASLHDIFAECCQRLKDSGRLLIVDEAEQLPYKALEMLRRLHDKTGIGILLTGMPKLLANLRGNKGEYAQLYSRVGIAVKLTPLSEKDSAHLLDKLMSCEDKIRKAFHRVSAGNTRRLLKMVTRSKHLAQLNATEITEEVVQAAASFVKLEVMS
jgi:DNA transposition AAA+ family ATPase